MSISQRTRGVLRSVNWFWPAYMRRGYVMDIVSKLESEPLGPARVAVFEAELPRMYTAGHISAMLLDRYAHVPMVSSFQRQIGEAIEAAYLGLHHAAVALLIPTIEGIVREHAALAQRSLRNAGSRELNVEIRSMVDHERLAHPACSASEERVAMIEMFGEFLTQSLYLDTRVFAGNRELNRHGAVHGIYRDFGSATNFYVLISLIDLLTFVLTFRTSGVSMLAPEITVASRRLATYYFSLRELVQRAGTAAGSRR